MIERNFNFFSFQMFFRENAEKSNRFMQHNKKSRFKKMATTAAPETKTTRSFQGPVKILVCIDGSPEASLALKRAIQMKKPDDTLLLVAIAKEHKPKWYV